MSFDVGQRLKRLREYYKLTQMQMAERADIDDKYYGRIERNESAPTVSVIEKICSGLDIPLVQFFMPQSKELSNDVSGEYHVQKTQAENMKYEIDIHFNRDALLKDCCHCLWYSGYIASAFLDEYELQLTVEGNIRAQVYVDYAEVANINDRDASYELMKYVKNDQALKEMMVREEYSEEILKEHHGNTVFVPESNWLSLSLINHLSGELIDAFDLDTENIFEPFTRRGADLVDYIFL